MKSLKFVVDEDKYEMRELSAQDAMDAINAAVQGREDISNLTMADYNKIIIEASTTVNGEPLKLDFKKIPHRVWSMLLAASDRINTVSDKEARFLPSSSGETKPQSTPP